MRFAIDAYSATTLIVCGVEVYAPKRVLEIAWDHAGTAELTGYGPGEWEGTVKAAKDWPHRTEALSSCAVRTIPGAVCCSAPLTRRS